MEAARVAVMSACCLLLHEWAPWIGSALAEEPQSPAAEVAGVSRAMPKGPAQFAAPAEVQAADDAQAPDRGAANQATLNAYLNRLSASSAFQADGRVSLMPPAAEAGEEVLPISLPAAMRLANTRAWDIALAVQQLRIASAQLLGARVLWLPNIVGGVDYVHHDGPSQDLTTGALSGNSYSSMYAGIAPLAIFGLTDAIFEPLAQRQVTRAQDANVQTATNDTLSALADTYFDAVEARADLAGIDDVVQRMRLLTRITVALAREGLVPDLEVARVQAALASAEEVRETARQRWRVAAAEAARVIRLKPTVLVTPVESPQLQITLVPPERTPEELIPLALRNRPEMTYNDALVQAARHRVRQERSRPFLPIFLVRGAGTQVPYPMAFGAFGGGAGGTLSNFNVRSDFDLEAIWQVNNLGFGNRALIRQRVEEHELARIEAFKVRDIVAKEVTQVWADLRSAYRRVGQAQRELDQAWISANKNLMGVRETKRVAGAIRILIIRPLEAVVAQQALNQAYYDYFGAVADYNRAQFDMYRALGSPAQALGDVKKALIPQTPGAEPPAIPNAVLEEAPLPRRVGQP